MIKSFFFLATLLLTSIPVFAQSVDTAWVRRYNGPGNAGDGAQGIAVDSSGNVYVTGYSYGDGTDCDYATIKYYTDGDTAWVRRYNGPANSMDSVLAHPIAVDESGNVYVTGASMGIGTDGDYATIKYNPDGDTVWLRRYNGPANDADGAWAVAVDGSDNVCVFGMSWGSETSWDFATIKYNNNGDTVWVRRYNGPGNGWDIPSGIAVDGSGNVYVTGNIDDELPTEALADYATIKYEPDGDTGWVRRYDGGNDWDRARAVAVDDSGNVYVTGVSECSESWGDYATIKYEPDGDTAWVRRYNGPGNDYDNANAIAIDNSNNVYITGESGGSGTADDYATIKYYPNGDTAWVRRYNGIGNYDDEALAIAVDSCGNAYVTGYSWNGTNFDYATVKYDSSGNQLWVAIYDGTGNGDDEANAIAVCGCDTVYVTGESHGSGTDKDYATIKYVQKETFVEGYEDQNQIRSFTLYQNYPNPFNPITNIEFMIPEPAHVRIEIFNVLGEKIVTLADQKLGAGYKIVEWDGKDDQGREVSTGIYFYRFQAGDFTQTRKMVLLK